MHSGTSANDEVRPASTLLRMPGRLASQPRVGLAVFIFNGTGSGRRNGVAMHAVRHGMAAPAWDDDGRASVRKARILQQCGPCGREGGRRLVRGGGGSP